MWGTHRAQTVRHAKRAQPASIKPQSLVCAKHANQEASKMLLGLVFALLVQPILLRRQEVSKSLNVFAKLGILEPMVVLAMFAPQESTKM